MSAERELFKTTKLLMVFSGLWRLELSNSRRFVRSAYKIYSLSLQVFFNSVIISFVLEFCRLVSNDINTAIKILSRLIYVALLTMKLTLCQSKSMRKLLSIALQDESDIYRQHDSEIRRIYTKHVKYCNKITTAITICSFVLDIYLTEIGIEKSYKFSHNTANSSLERPLPSPLWYPFDRNKFHVCALTYQIIETFLTAIYSGSVQGVSNTVTIFFRAQLQILQHQLRHFDRFEFAQSDGEIGNHLRILVQKHQDLIKWFDQLNQLFKKILLLEYSVSSMLMAAVLIQIFQGEDVMFNGIYFCFIFGQLTILSWNANEIKIQSSELSQSLYESRWFECRQAEKMVIRIMMMRCQKPLTLTIGSFGAMTADVALSRIKLAYSYVSLVSGGSGV
ncbi:odorant receptor 67c-like [Cylas formicarius]|uniref:odorant receptor 67c-like n=1 Tax=Cylas formicarius TaxID=197179 RepID=UPI00295879A9|nr:odorant receptor 67c-like [Cylas formicarius]